MGFSGCVVRTTYSPSPLAYPVNRERIKVTQSAGYFSPLWYGLQHLEYGSLSSPPPHGHRSDSLAAPFFTTTALSSPPPISSAKPFFFLPRAIREAPRCDDRGGRGAGEPGTMGARRRLGEATALGRRPAGDARGDARAIAASALASTRGIVSGLRRGRRSGGACESA